MATDSKVVWSLIESRRQYGLADPKPWLVVTLVYGLHEEFWTEAEAKAAAQRYQASAHFPEGAEPTVYHWPTVLAGPRPEGVESVQFAEPHMGPEGYAIS
jgi:hypothetical protein